MKRTATRAFGLLSEATSGGKRPALDSCSGPGLISTSEDPPCPTGTRIASADPTSSLTESGATSGTVISEEAPAIQAPSSVTPPALPCEGDGDEAAGPKPKPDPDSDEWEWVPSPARLRRSHRISDSTWLALELE